MAQILAKDYNKAKNTLAAIDSPDAYTDYLMAVLGARTNNTSMAVSYTHLKERCTALYGVPTMFIAELNHPMFDMFDMSSLRTGIMAGSLCPVELLSLIHIFTRYRAIVKELGLRK